MLLLLAALFLTLPVFASRPRPLTPLRLHLLAPTRLPLGASVSPPGSIFNLTGWKLQLPLSNGKGGVIEVSQPALSNYTSEYFYTNATDDSMAFWCPINGAHTSGSGFPRSELRELYNFTTQGDHVISATIRVLQVPPAESITIGQAHIDGVSGACSIFCELEWTKGSIVSHVRTQSCSGIDMKLPVREGWWLWLGPPYGL
jgi:hypothetical protein